MKIGDLARNSGFSISTLYDYLRSGILQPPVKESPTKAHFTPDHLTRLKDIQRLKDEKKSLNDIKTLFAGQNVEGEDSLETSEKVRYAIIDKALELFSSHHYENTKISDITQALNMGNGTFYRYFKSKEELFLYCLERLPRVLVPKDAWTEVNQEADYIKRLKKRGYAMLNAFPSYIAILNYAKLALGGKDATLARKAAECIDSLIRPLEKDLKNAIAQGHVRDVDPELCATLLLGINEAFGYRLLMDPNCSVEKGFSAIEDFITHALTPNPNERVSTGCKGDLTDTAGNTLPLKDIRFDGKQVLSGYYLQGLLEVDFSDIERIEITDSKGSLDARLHLKNGNSAHVSLAPGLLLSGKSSLGQFSISARKIKHIAFSG
jgi:AcrR family transcriptional regulator